MGGLDRLRSMNRYEFITVGLRLLGLLCLMFAVPKLLLQAVAFLQTLHSLDWQLRLLPENLSWAQSHYGFSPGGLFVGCLQLAFGLYLLLDGRWLQRRITRMERSACPECGYSLSGIEKGERCPECGGVRA